MVGRNIGVIMKLGVLKEPAEETRVAIVPTSMKKLLKAGFEVVIESGAGRLANYSDEEYTKIMSEPPRFWHEFPTYKKRFERLRPFFKVLAKANLVPMSFYLKY